MSFWHFVVVAALIVLLFGRGKVSDLMGDLGKGIRTFKKEMVDEKPRASSPREKIAVDANLPVALPPDAGGGRGDPERDLDGDIAIPRTPAAR